MYNMEKQIKTLKGTKRIIISDLRDLGVVISVYLQEWKRKHWWSLKRSWVIIDGLGTCFDDNDMHIQNTIDSWLENDTNFEIEFINLSSRFKYFPFWQTRRVLIEKKANGKGRKSAPKRKFVKPKRVICIGDGTLEYYAISYIDGSSITPGKKYLSREHYSNKDRSEVAEKLLFIKDNFGKVGVYPKRFFKEV